MKKVEEESPATSIGNASVDTSPGVKQTVMVDRRYSPTKQPRLLKKFSKYVETK
jgi:hypothetical protein